MKTLKAFAVLFIALFVGSPVASLAADQPRAQHVFIVSYDQGAPRIIQQSEMPTFKKMALEGAHTWEAYTIVPSVTLPSHTSMLTGVGIQKHQISWNDWKPEKGLVKVPTIFSLAKERHLVTAMVVGKEKFKHLDLPGSLDRFLVAGNCLAVAEAFAKEVAPLKPNLCFLHFADPDSTGHKYGVGSPEQLAALADCDKALDKIREAIAVTGMADSSVIILSADHGGHSVVSKEGKTTGVHGSSDPDDVLIPWVAWGKGVKKQFTITAPVVTYDTAATALWLLGVPVPEGFWGRPVTSAFE